MEGQSNLQQGIISNNRRRIYYLIGFFAFISLTIGLKLFAAFVAIGVAFFAGFIWHCIHTGYARREKIKQDFEEWARTFRFSQGLEFAKAGTTQQRDLEDEHAESMTNSPLLEPILEQILDNILRDNIDSWYAQHLSADNRQFQNSLKRTARRTVIAFRTCIAQVDWVPLLTKHLITDFASHMRLYRKAKERLQMQKELNMVRGNADDDQHVESLFFDLELEVEKIYCRDLVSTSPAYENAYLHDVSDILLYLLMPPEDFRCRPLRFLVRESVVNIFVQLLDLLSEPAFINKTIVWVLSELAVNTDDFVASLENCKCVQELEAILEAIHDEEISIRSKGKQNGPVEQGSIFTSQLASLEFTKNLICRRMMSLTDKTDKKRNENRSESYQFFVPTQNAGGQIDGNGGSGNDDFAVNLSFTVILTHPIALAHFVEFLTECGRQNYIDFYLAIEGFKNSMRHQKFSGDLAADNDIQETLREAALFMYHQYLSHEAITRVPLNDSIVNKFLAHVRNDIPSDFWFEQIQNKLVEILQTDADFFPAFKRHGLYRKMLDELGIGPRSTSPSEEPEEDIGEVKESLDLAETNIPKGQKEAKNKFEEAGKKAGGEKANSVVVEMLGVGHQGRHLFALYNVRVTRADLRGGSSSNVIRRYSDFHTFHNLITSKFPNLSTLSFPGKKTFNNLDQDFLDKRCVALNQYMKQVLHPSLLEANPGLEPLVFDFLSQKQYTGRGARGLPRAMVMGSMRLFNPLVSGIVNEMKAFGSAAAAMPSDLIDGIGKMGSELNKAASSMLKTNSGSTSARESLKRTLQTGTSASTGKLTPDRGAFQIDENESIENIPLRILLLLVDEVFGFRAKNQWLRRRLVSLLRQLVNATLGSTINKRIIDAVNWLISEEQIAQYLIAFRDCIWSDSESFSEQGGTHSLLKTRFLARYLILSSIPDQLRMFIGASSIHAGVENVSEVLQNPRLNRRFWYVVFERLLVTVFPTNRFDRILPQLHAKSPRKQMA